MNFMTKQEKESFGKLIKMQEVFDQVYKMLVSIRSEIRDAYDKGSEKMDETAHFYIDREKNFVIRGEEVDDGAVACTVSFDSNDKNLRQLARETTSFLLEDL